jgi:Ca2+-binding EF-hand superfamily protein
MNDLTKRIAQGLLGVFAGCALTLAAVAQEGHQHQPPPFADFDVDGNGSISETEFNSVRSQHMAARAAEGKKMRCAATAPAFADIDTNGDASLSADELGAGQQAHMEKCRAMGQGEGMGKGGQQHMHKFSDIDVDANGMISAAELNDAHSARMAEMAAEGHAMKHAGDKPDFDGIDSNGDGGISEQEFAAHQAAHHAQMQDKQQQE